MGARATSPPADTRPLVAHVVYRFDVGGLENGVANLINRMPADAYRHAVVALTEITDFRRRIERDDVEFVAIGKGPGHGFKIFPELFRVFRQLAPAIAHTRNLAALEASAPAWAARVPVRLHGEHGREVADLDGSNRTHRAIRRIYSPFVDQYVALSDELARYLHDAVGIGESRIARICNGVDADRFAPAAHGRPPIDGCPFAGDELWLVGTVGRMQAVKDQVTLARAFVRMVGRDAAVRRRARLVLVGDGELRAQCEQVLEEAGVRDLAWFAGERGDVAEVLRGLDCFVLPSLAEGISNTILEAMASGLPVVATAVGGNVELVADGESGRLVPAADCDAIAAALLDYCADPERARRDGQAGRSRILRHFSIDRMVHDYQRLYDRLLERSRFAKRGNAARRSGVARSLRETR